MPQGNYNYDAGYIMNSDKTSVDDPMGSNQLTREGLQFDTRASQDVLTQDAPKQQSKPTVEASLFAMAEQRDY
jgi:hypothetical protein|tara:strand:+ start:242 stop:460 length:219 start_codon:yes stop_codon:yes gene_type:complete